MVAPIPIELQLVNLVTCVSTMGEMITKVVDKVDVFTAQVGCQAIDELPGTPGTPVTPRVRKRKKTNQSVVQICRR